MKRLLKNRRGIATILVVVLIVLGVVVVGIVAAGAVLLSNAVVITVNNQTGNTLDVAQGSAALRLNFLPGINLPSQIAPGDTAEIQVPQRFIDWFTFSPGSVQVHAFSQSFAISTSSINMQRSTWDGAPLAGLVGKQVAVSGNHTLVLSK
jgi:hypothetical protein